MLANALTIFTAAAAVVNAASIPLVRRSGSASVTPHDKYSSSIGVPGCKINTNRVAYWPMGVDCNNICVKLSHGGRSVHLLKIDTSGGAYDVSYDAWNYLGFGKSATEDPQMGGGIGMNYEFVDNSECAHLLDDGKLPLSAANSMNYVASCISEPNSWVAKNHKLLNIMDPLCKWGRDEECHLDLSVSNQPSCPSGLGKQEKLSMTVKDIAYGSGKVVAAA
ncbi:hypothetical protein S7711_00185 [Stachybotrys chartarum IBT 7711]|uniref:Cerato-platanin n=1 Tax=Stachybotrys chartarum (strain CBS 109288 / IBT 7711) TaxID=1280523 RepID=A0A084B3P8_STACB|nr:hypothetical protein S7711_00185 [Stachybotrys chartarum IBT 7711]KFA52328.1 hypothetical protein S40293_00582 [Stachybotrys chartarum IBT 40293]